MLVNICIPGLGTTGGLAAPLHELGLLRKFYYSHARWTTPASLGVPDDRARNLWMKEYLTRGHLRFIGWHFADTGIPIYYRFWEHGVLRDWEPAPVAHVLLWGAARRILARAKADGSTTLGFAVNAHPHHFVELLREEGDRLGVKAPKMLGKTHHLMMEEFALCDHLHVESEFIKKSFAARGFPSERIHVLHLGKDFTKFYPATAEEQRADDGRFRVLCVGAISLRKGQAHLLEAWKRLRLPDADLTLIGHLNPDIETIVRRYAGQFTHISRAPELRPHLIRSSVFVAPSIEDGYANVVAEALACGIPVITTTNTGAADHIRDGYNGYVVPISSPEAIAERLERIYRDRGLLEKLKEGARATIPTIGTWTERAQEFAKLYRRLTDAAA